MIVGFGLVALTAAVCGGQPASFTVQPNADAFVTPGASGSLSSSNFGAAGSLAIAAAGLPQGEFQSVLRFDLSAAQSSFNTQFGAGQWTIQSVTLQLTSSPHNNPIFNNIATGQFGVSLMQNNLWVEGTGTGGIPSSDGISFSSLQSTYINNATDQTLGTFNFPGGSSGQNSYQLALASGLQNDVTSGGILSLRLFAADNQVSYLFTSRSGISIGKFRTAGYFGAGGGCAGTEHNCIVRSGPGASLGGADGSALDEPQIATVIATKVPPAIGNQAALHAS